LAKRPLVPLFAFVARCLARGLLLLSVSGAENVPAEGALLLTMNHLGGADPVLVLGFCPRRVVAVGKAEALRWPLIGWVLQAYGMVPVRPGTPDRAALGALLGRLAVGEVVLIAPEGHESRSGALEAGKGGAAFLAQRSGARLLPVAITGTAWRAVLPAWRRLRRPCVTLTFGVPYQVSGALPRSAASDDIMQHIAALLPAAYRGVYAVGARTVE
jgi:1-acyl-sn-glycerol-3-phosphate acyltransferase